jgi:hypothetical protein
VHFFNCQSHPLPLRTARLPLGGADAVTAKEAEEGRLGAGGADVCGEGGEVCDCGGGVVRCGEEEGGVERVDGDVADCVRVDGGEGRCETVRGWGRGRGVMKVKELASTSPLAPPPRPVTVPAGAAVIGDAKDVNPPLQRAHEGVGVDPFHPPHRPIR